MSEKFPHRLELANISTPLVVFLMGIHVHSPLNIKARYFIRKSMIAILRELETNRPEGYLAHEYHSGKTSLLIAYWREHEKLLEYARNKSAKHFPAWYEFNSTVSKMDAIGLWHEIYNLNANSYKGVYKNSPPSGMGKFLLQDRYN